MGYHRYEPIDPRDAFTVTPRLDSESTQSAAASQAAMLLATRAGVLGNALQTEEVAGFALPKLSALRRTRHMTVSEAHEYLGVSAQELNQEAEPRLEREMTKATHDLYDNPSIKVAAALFEAAMLSPHPLVAVAGAAGARETTRLRQQIWKTLVHGAESDDPLTARLAQAAMSEIPPMGSTAKKRVIKQPKSKKRRRESKTSVVTHGTFAATSLWYQPGGDFYDALKANRPDLDVHDQSFTWTGAYSRSARRADAALLDQWIQDQGLAGPDFFAHSHGATVAHLATRRGVRFNRLVLMSWPVHSEWFPDFANVNRIIDIRVRLDLVILLDRGGQRFDTTQFNVEEHRNGWFDHSSTHESAYWDDHGLWDVV